jgi:molybdopterin/thiamine biosynthesis adenylyltransferase
MCAHRIILSEKEIERYDRQIIFSGWGEEGQRRLKQATVFIAGAGGLGSSAAVYLAAAGVGCIRICDAGTIELSNLNRQILHSDGDIGEKKVQSAARKLHMINPHVQVICLFDKIERTNISQLVSDADIVIDCLDNFGSRYIINEYTVKKKLPFIHAGVYGMAGQLTFIHSPQTPCLRCIFSEAPSPELFPVIGATTGVVGSLEALEVLKYLTGINGLLKSRLLIWEGDLARFEEIQLEKNPTCPVCSNKSNELTA